MTTTQQPEALNAIISDLRTAHAHASHGVWGKGKTTHHTSANRGDGAPYHVAEFRHADDAQFCDTAHALVPKLIAEAERLHARVVELEAELDKSKASSHQYFLERNNAREAVKRYQQEIEAIGAGGVESLRGVKPPTDEQVIAAAHVLNDRSAAACGVDKDDQWKIYSDEFMSDARSMLNAAHGIGS